MRRLTHQQAFGFAGEQEGGDGQHAGDAQRGHAIQDRHLQQLRGEQADQREAQAEQGGAVFQQHGERGGVLAAAEGFEVAQRTLGGAELAQRDPPRGALEHDRDAEHDVADQVVGGRLGIADVLDAFVGRYTGAGREHQQCHDEAPEVQLAPVAEGMQGVRLLLRAAQAIQQQQLVDGVHQGVDALAEHGRTAGNAGGDELGDGDCEVAG